ncbi:MAG TPA: proprotein convertase P-domain-containing protein [Blastocatellia bacterium]|nr:proprotein convertase P-domain-containing protein [Blastocatellia bacterium]
MRNSRKLTHRAFLVTVIASLLILAIWQSPSLLAFSSNAVRSVFNDTTAKTNMKAAPKSLAAVQQLTKEQKLARMKELLADIARLKSQPGQQAALASAQSELNQISASLGGDLPSNEGSVPGQNGGGPQSVIPAPPTGCVMTTVNAANNTSTAIPDVATITSTITVAGANPYLWDLNLFTNISHTFPGDLDITLTSPAGTVVTITTDNAGTNDNVFAGTLWDDQAGTPVTEFVFASNVLATPLVVEEALGAFHGQNPNGVWTLTITDDTGQDTGTLNNWSLEVSGLAAAPPITMVSQTNNANQAIIDVGTISSMITIAGAPTKINDMDLGTFITHTFPGDLDITLTSPAGTVVTITTDNGGTNDNVFNGTGWDDQAGTPVTDFTFANGVTAPTLVPEEAMAAFQGENPNGTWTLTITDDQGQDTGTLVSWSLEFETTNGCAQACAITCPANITVKTFGASAVVNYPAPTTTGSCGTVTCTPASGSTFQVGTTTVTCTAAGAAPVTCSFNVMVMRVPGAVALTDVGCTAPGDAITGTATFTNNTGASAASSATIALDPNLIAVPGSCSADVGTCTVVNSSTISWSGTLANNQAVNITYTAQINVVPPGTTVCATMTATIGGMGVQGSLQGCITTNCQPKGPGNGIPYTSEMSDQKAGSVLIYNIYTSGATSGNTQNTRLNITNADPSRAVFVHLFFVAEGCSVADSYLCLTANQTASFLASDLDPGTTGYLVAVAVNQIGCPITANCLIGDEYVKFTSGHAANLGAEAFAGIAGGLPLCDGNSVTAAINFDGISYNRVPRVLALDNVGSRADGNDTLVVLNRIGGNLGIGASTLGTLFGIFYDDAENALSFSVSGSCQLRNSISNNFPRTTPRFETFIPAGRTGWAKVFSQSPTDIGILGSAINFNPNAASSAGAFNQGHNLHALTLSSSNTYVIPVFPPSC